MRMLEIQRGGGAGLGGNYHFLQNARGAGKPSFFLQLHFSSFIDRTLLVLMEFE